VETDQIPVDLRGLEKGVVSDVVMGERRGEEGH